MLNIEYPRTEIMAVLGSKVYPLYITADTKELEEKMQMATREDFLKFKAAIRKEHGKGLWFPSCGEEPEWTEWTVKKNTIKSYLKLPKPEVRVDYSKTNDLPF